MATPDLPVELWLEILAYLPRSTLHKMMGVNRLLFELALDDLYEDIQFINDDKDMLKTFKQLKHSNIARRARRLLVRPSFLPGMDEDTRNSSLDKLASGFTYLKNIAQKPKSIASRESLQDPAYVILDAAKTGLRLCPNLQELTIVLHDHALTPSFFSFLDSLWVSNSIGPNLKKLTINTTIIKLPLLLKPVVKCSAVLTNLEEVDISISDSRFKHQTEWTNASQALVSFFETFRQKLISISFSSSVVCDLAILFDSFNRFSKLKVLQLFLIFNAQTLAYMEKFTMFIAKQSSTLEHLTLKARPRQISYHHNSDETYNFWLNQTQPSDIYTFPQLVLPKLKSLDVELRELPSHWNYSTKALLPKLAQVSPNLTTLILTHISLSFNRISDLIDGLPRSDEGVIILESMAFVTDFLSPQLFDLLASKLSLLKSLVINIQAAEWSLYYDRYHGRHSSLDETLQARRYPTWGLRSLRVTTISACEVPHPSIIAMKAVAKCLPGVALDSALHCSCDTQ